MNSVEQPALPEPTPAKPTIDYKALREAAQPEREEPPFAGPLKLVGEGRKGNFMQVENHPETFIRQRLWMPEQKLKQEREHFDELRRYVPVPNYQPIIGPNENGKPGAYLLAETIYGKPLNDYLKASDPRPPDFEASVNQTCEGLADYLRDSIKAKSKIYWDIKSQNFMYGNTERDDTPHVYMSDLDPTFKLDTKTPLYCAINLFDEIDQVMPLSPDAWRKLKSAVDTDMRVNGSTPAQFQQFLDRFDETAQSRVN